MNWQPGLLNHKDVISCLDYGILMLNCVSCYGSLGICVMVWIWTCKSVMVRWLNCYKLGLKNSVLNGAHWM